MDTGEKYLRPSKFPPARRKAGPALTCGLQHLGIVTHEKIEHPYGELTGGQWLRGNLHCHTTKSDGERAPQAVIDDYARRGYDFLMLSDHDVFMSAGDLSCLDAKGMVLIPGTEVSADGPHILHVNAGRHASPACRGRRCSTRSPWMTGALP